MSRRTAAARLLVVPAVLAALDATQAGKDWWAHIQFLADDALEGRKAGTEGHRKAAAYVTEQFRQAGLEPGTASGFVQEVAFKVRQIVDDKCSFALVRGGNVIPFALGREVTVSARGIPGRPLEAEAVFVGQGVVIPEKGINDLKGLDLKGKIAVMLRGFPKGIPNELAAHAASSVEQWKALRAAGAIGVASVYNTNHSDIPWERSAAARFAPTLTLAEPALAETSDVQVSVLLHPAAFDKMLAGTGHTSAELLALDKSQQPLPKFPIPGQFRVVSTYTEKAATSENVIGIKRGSDPVLKQEYVVYSAHLDHLGVGQPVPSDPTDRIYNGAMDNASGIASLIEVAKSLHGATLKRSILFAAVTGEEGGLLGSKYFANRPTVPAQNIVADVNTDMFLPIIPLRAMMVLGLNESDLGPEFTEVAKRFSLPVKADPEPQRSRFTRSDQYSFIRRGVPALAFKFYADPHTPDGAVLAQWTKERYHAPSDDLKQPVNVEGAVRFNEVMSAFLVDVANRQARPRWNDTSFFRRFAADAN